MPIDLDEYSLREKDWDILVDKIKKGKCTPFLGSGACGGKIPTGTKLAQELATKYKYPFNDSDDLAKVTQFLVVDFEDPIYVKDNII